MIKLSDYLRISRCPHCSVDTPNLNVIAAFETNNDLGTHLRVWKAYACKRCGGITIAWGGPENLIANEIYPDIEKVNDLLPPKVKAYLQQAIDSTFTPAGSVMLSASAVDAMLKEKNYKEGSLYSRIKKGIEEHLLTPEMGTWAHQVRLDANDQRHADDNAELPTVEDAKQAIEFAKTLAEFLFVLPSKVSRGIAISKHDNKSNVKQPNNINSASKGEPDELDFY